MKKTLKLATLVEDFALYPRNRVDESHIGDLVRAVLAGHELPALLVETGTLRIVDGFHRRRALLRALGPDAVHEVELRKYASEAELFLDAVACNSHHGRKLDRHDQSRIVLKLRELQVSDERIAVTLHVPPQQIQTLAVRVVYAPSGEAKPAKRGIHHLYGQNLTTEQIAALDSVRSAEAGRLALELIRLLRSGLVDLNDEIVVARLRELSDVIGETLPALVAA